MKTTRIISFLLIFIVIFICCKQSTKEEVPLYNGISPQILSIVDSIPICEEDDNPFITIWFSTLDGNDCIVRFINSALIPAPPEPPAPIKETLISENEGFMGYKKYSNKYLVFLEYFPNRGFEKFINRDSLNKDEEPFKKYNIYKWKKESLNCDPYERIYLINKKDSLVFVEQKRI